MGFASPATVLLWVLALRRSAGTDAITRPSALRNFDSRNTATLRARSPDSARSCPITNVLPGKCRSGSKCHTDLPGTDVEVVIAHCKHRMGFLNFLLEDIESQGLSLVKVTIAAWCQVGQSTRDILSTMPPISPRFYPLLNVVLTYGNVTTADHAWAAYFESNYQSLASQLLLVSIRTPLLTVGSHARYPYHARHAYGCSWKLLVTDHGAMIIVAADPRYMARRELFASIELPASSRYEDTAGSRSFWILMRISRSLLVAPSCTSSEDTSCCTSLEDTSK